MLTWKAGKSARTAQNGKLQFRFLGSSGMRTLHWIALFLLAVGPAAAADLDVTSMGAVGDGKTDCTAAFQKALDAVAAKGGGIVNVPAGHYRIDGRLKIPGAVTLQGTFRTPPTDQREDRPKLDGSVLLAFAGRGSRDGEPFIRLAGSTATLAGLMIAYPEWKQTDVPPVPYPPTVLTQDTVNTAILDCCFLNSYEAIRYQSAARFLVRNVHGYPTFRGLYVDACYDIGRVENVHFWPFGVTYKPDDPFCKWVNVNGVAFEFARTDWQYVVNTFCFGYGVGYKFSRSQAGSCNGNFLGIGADSCRRAVLVEDSQYPGLLITNGEFVGRWGSDDSVCLEVAESASEGKVSLNNCSFWGPIDRCVWLRSPAVQFTAIGTHFREWDVNRRGTPAIQLDAGKAIVQGNTFGRGDLHILVGPKVRSAILMANQAAGGFNVDNQAAGRTQLVANEQNILDTSETAKSHYRLDIGAPDDNRYVRKCFAPESCQYGERSDKTIRWSTSQTEFHLPVLRGKPYTVNLDLNLPQAAVDPANGLYLGDQRVMELPAKAYLGTVTGRLPACDKDHVILTLKVKTWCPKDADPNSKDMRRIGAALCSLTMKADGAGDGVTNANTGDAE